MDRPCARLLWRDGAGAPAGARGRPDRLGAVNVDQMRLPNMLKILEVEGAIERAGSKWRAHPEVPDGVNTTIANTMTKMASTTQSQGGKVPRSGRTPESRPTRRS
jgi:hypothetical protein